MTVIRNALCLFLLIFFWVEDIISVSFLIFPLSCFPPGSSKKSQEANCEDLNDLLSSPNVV
jgi:hypothetical protein